MRLLLVLPLILLAPRALGAQGIPYADPQQRFTVLVPDAWTSKDLGDQGLELHGSGLTIVITPLAAAGSPREVVATLVRQLSTQWQNLREFDRREISIMGQQSAWTLFEGTDPGGKPGGIRVQGMQGGGVTVGVLISGEPATYFAQRGSIEATLATLRLGTNPPLTFGGLTAAGGVPHAGSPQPPPPEQAPAPASEEGGIGLDVRDIDADEVENLGLTDERGAVVDEVQPGGAADGAGIRPNDVILEVDRTAVTDADDFERRLESHKAGDTVELLLARHGRKRTVSVRVK
ncbi:MAG: PDZ domain-containing protein [Gemmatimonadota bacterium]